MDLGVTGSRWTCPTPVGPPSRTILIFFHQGCRLLRGRAAPPRTPPLVCQFIADPQPAARKGAQQVKVAAR